MDVKETYIIGDDINNHWYYKSKMKAMLHLLGGITPSSILDVGAGSGLFSRSLLAQTSAKEAWCVDINYESDSDSTEAGKPLYFRRSIDRIDADLVLLMDVLEHVDDDVGLLKDYVGKVPRGASFLISVPAFQFLWSGHDIFLEHKRRYRLEQIEKVAECAGLKVKQGTYYFGAVFPIAATIRITEGWFRKETRQVHSQLSRHNPLVNGILTALSQVELSIMMRNRIAGLTAFCLAKRR